MKASSWTRVVKLPGCAGCAFALAALLGSCGPEPQAPSPTPNPHPHEFTRLKITVEPGSGVTDIRVESAWIVGNDSCAPHQPWPSPAPITKQVNVSEKVDKTGLDEWTATIVGDRFLPDKCKWLDGGYDVKFLQKNLVISSMATEKRNIEQAGILKLTCKSQEIQPFPPVCFMRSQEAFFKAKHYKIFNATMEIVK